MTRSQKITPWRNMVAATLLIMFSLGINSSGMTMFYLPVTQELGFTQTQFSLYYTITMLCSGAVMPFVGKLISRFREKLRVQILICLAINGLVIVAYSFSRHLWQFYVLSVIRGVVFGLTSGIPATVILNDWFEDKRALATSIAFVGASLGGIIFTRLSRFVIYGWSWQRGYLVLGLLELVAAPVITLLVSPTPRQMQLQPYRDGKPRKTRRQDANTGFMLAEVVRMPLFWVFALGAFCLNICAVGTMQNVNSSLMTDGGYTSVQAANLFTILQISVSVGSVLIGWLLDKIGFAKVVTLLCCMFIGAMICMLNNSVMVCAVLAVILFGCGNNISTSVSSGLTSEIFGLKDYGSIYGLVSTVIMLGMSAGPVVAGRIFDLNGTYRGVWMMCIGLICVVLTCYLVPYVAGTRGRLVPPKKQTTK